MEVPPDRLSLLATWGNFFWPLMVTRGPEFRPLSVGMQVFFSNPNVPWGDILAFGVMYTLPPLLIYLLFQRWFIQSVASSGVMAKAVVAGSPGERI